MLTLNDLINILKNNMTTFKEKYNVQKLGIFGFFCQMCETSI